MSFEIKAMMPKRQVFGNLLDTGEDSDVKFIIESGLEPGGQRQRDRFFAHKFMLKMASPVFRSMLKSSTAEKDTKSILHLTDVNPNIFYFLLRFIYLKKVHLKSAGDFLALFKLDEQYHVSGLRTSILEWVASRECPEACRVFYQHALSTGDKELMELCMAEMSEGIVSKLLANSEPSDDDSPNPIGSSTPEPNLDGDGSATSETLSCPATTETNAWVTKAQPYATTTATILTKDPVSISNPSITDIDTIICREIVIDQRIAMFLKHDQNVCKLEDAAGVFMRICYRNGHPGKVVLLFITGTVTRVETAFEEMKKMCAYYLSGDDQDGGLVWTDTLMADPVKYSIEKTEKVGSGLFTLDTFYVRTIVITVNMMSSLRCCRRIKRIMNDTSTSINIPPEAKNSGDTTRCLITGERPKLDKATEMLTQLFNHFRVCTRFLSHKPCTCDVDMNGNITKT